MGHTPLDDRTQKELDRILAKDPSELTLADKQFLRARAAYVGTRSRQKFHAAFTEELPVTTPEPEEETTDETNNPFDEESDGEDEE